MDSFITDEVGTIFIFISQMRKLKDPRVITCPRLLWWDYLLCCRERGGWHWRVQEGDASGSELKEARLLRLVVKQATREH